MRWLIEGADSDGNSRRFAVEAVERADAVRAAEGLGVVVSLIVPATVLPYETPIIVADSVAKLNDSAQNMKRLGKRLRGLGVVAAFLGIFFLLMSVGTAIDSRRLYEVEVPVLLFGIASGLAFATAVILRIVGRILLHQAQQSDVIVEMAHIQRERSMPSP